MDNPGQAAASACTLRATTRSRTTPRIRTTATASILGTGINCAFFYWRNQTNITYKQGHKPSFTLRFQRFEKLKLWRCEVYLNDADANTISCNWVQNNSEIGFRLYSGSTGNTIEHNNIIANGVYNDTSDGYEWQFMNNQSYEVNTAGNWWGTNDETRINASIYDWTYHAGWGNVTTNPSGGSAPCAPVPELPTVVLFAVGLLVLAGYVRLGRRKT